MRNERRGCLSPNSRLFLDPDILSCICYRDPPARCFSFFLLTWTTLLSLPGQRKCGRVVDSERVLKTMHSSSTCRQPSSGNQQTLRQVLSYVIPTLSVDVSGSVNSHPAISLAADISSCARLTRCGSVEPVNHGLVDIAFIYQIAQAHDRRISSLGLLSLPRRGGRTT